MPSFQVLISLLGEPPLDQNAFFYTAKKVAKIIKFVIVDDGIGRKVHTSTLFLNSRGAKNRVVLPLKLDSLFG